MHVNNINIFLKNMQKKDTETQCVVYSEQAGSGRLCDEVSSGNGPEQSDGVSHDPGSDWSLDCPGPQCRNV